MGVWVFLWRWDFGTKGFWVGICPHFGERMRFQRGSWEIYRPGSTGRHWDEEAWSLSVQDIWLFTSHVLAAIGQSGYDVGRSSEDDAFSPRRLRGVWHCMIILSVHRAREAGVFVQPSRRGTVMDSSGQSIQMDRELPRSISTAHCVVSPWMPSRGTILRMLPPEQRPRMSFLACLTEDDLHLTGLDRGCCCAVLRGGCVDVLELPPEHVNTNHKRKQASSTPGQPLIQINTGSTQHLSSLGASTDVFDNVIPPTIQARTAFRGPLRCNRGRSGGSGGAASQCDEPLG